MKSIASCLPGIVFLFLGITLSAQDAWTSVKAENNPAKRHENAFVKAGEKFYLLGGRGIKPVDIYDPLTGLWTSGAPAPLEISHFQAISHQGLIYVLGALVGGWPSETPLTHILIYDPLADSWIIGPEIPPHRQRGAAGAFSYQGKLYMVCGIVNGHTSGWVPWFDEYDPQTNSWKELPDAPRARDHLQAGVAADKLVISGGRKSGYQGKGFEATLAETDVYDFNTGSWITLPSPSGDIPTQRAGYTALGIGDEVVVIGGESGSQEKAHSEVEAFNVKSGSWRKLPPLQTGRHGTQLLASEGKLYIAAGCGNRGGSPELDSFEMYSPTMMNPVDDIPLSRGELSLSANSHDFETLRSPESGTVEFTLRNQGGNQGIPILYLVLTGNPAFKLDFPYPLPYVLGPDSELRFKLSFSPENEHAAQAELLIKQSDRGKVQPLQLVLKGNEHN